MSLITRGGKGAPLTIEEMDGNFTYLESIAGQGGSGATPSLQDVTDIGAVTTNTIIVGSESGVYSLIENRSLFVNNWDAITQSNTNRGYFSVFNDWDGDNYFDVYYETYNGSDKMLYEIYAYNDQLHFEIDNTAIIGGRKRLLINTDGFKFGGANGAYVTLNVDDVNDSYTLKLPNKVGGTYTLATTEDIIGGGSPSSTLQDVINASGGAVDVNLYPQTIEIDGIYIRKQVVGDLYEGNSESGLSIFNAAPDNVYRRFASSTLFSSVPTVFGNIYSYVRTYLGGTINITENVAGNSKSHNDLITTSSFAGMRSGALSFSKGGYYIGTINAIEIDSTSVYLSKYAYDDNITSSPVGPGEGALIKARIYNDAVTDNRDLFIIDASGDIPMVGYTAPGSATAPGVRGEVRITSTFIYTCINTNTWVRSTAATW